MIVDRRSVTAAADLSMAAAPAAPVARPVTRSKPGTFVLVHGTWLGGWIWADVAERLRRQGHRVFTRR